MIHLLLFLSLIFAQPSVSMNMEEKMANKTIIISPQSSIQNQSRPESEIAIETPYTNPVPLWLDDDVIIDSAYDYQAISTATQRSTGEIYLVASRRAGAGETYKIPCWHSSNGINWSQSFNITGSADLINPSLNIFTTADSEYLIIAYERVDTATGERDLRAYRQAIGTSTGIFSEISANIGLAEMDPDLCNSDLRYPNNPWLFCAFESDDSIGFVRSVDYGLTWTSRQIIGLGGATWNYRDPDCAFGWLSSPDSMFIGVAWQYVNTDGTRQIRFRKNTINGTPGYWRPIDYFTSPENKFDDYPSLQMTHGNYPSAVIMFVRKDTVSQDNADLYRLYTDNGADTWDIASHYNSSWAANVPHSLGIDESFGYYHLIYRDQSGSLRYQKAKYDSTWHAWSPITYVSSGSGWSDNDFPVVGVVNNQPYVCWVDYHSPIFKLKFNAEWLQTGIKEQKSSLLVNPIIITPNPSYGNIKISYNVKQKGSNKISIHNACGRLVKNLVNNDVTIGEHTISLNCQSIPAGVYFVSLETLDGNFRQRVTIAK